jgi:hypothetical protein
VLGVFGGRQRYGSKEGLAYVYRGEQRTTSASSVSHILHCITRLFIKIPTGRNRCQRTYRLRLADDDSGIDTAVWDIVAVDRIEREQVRFRRERDESVDIALADAVGERLIQPP